MRRRFAVLAVVLVVTAGAGAAQAQAIRGGVFEDLNYGGGAGRDSTTANGIARANARVELYDAAGAFSTSTVTGAAGDYVFPGLAAGTYYVRVVDASVSSSRAGYVAGTHLAVQTYRTDASTGTAVAVTNYVGGTDPTVADPGNGGVGTTFNTATFVFTAGLAGTAQSVAKAVVGGSDVVHVDFGFNFNTIVNVNDTGQGSLRQFLTNANGLANAGLAIVGQSAGVDASIFMISDGSAHPGQRAGLSNQLTAGTAIITPVTALPVITGAQTSLDGTTQTANIGNTNAVNLGTGGTVGVSALALGQVAGPEVAIRDTGALVTGVEINANSVTVRGLAIYGFGTAAPDGGILVDAAVSGSLIEKNVLGTTANSFTDPGAALYNRAGVYVNGAVNGTIQNNVVGYNGVTGIYLATGSTGWNVTDNEVKDNGTTTTDGDGITLNAAGTNSVTGNLVTGSSSQGIVATVAGSTGNVLTNNTVTGNGVGTPTGLVQSTGITMRNGAASTTLDRNIVNANYGAGLQVNNGASGTVMTRNSFFANGTITSRNGQAATGQIGIDLNAAADNIDLGTAPFHTLNDAGDADAGGNSLVNYPILSTAGIASGNLTMTGFARPGSTIEFFISDGDPGGFGEGQTYLFTAVEGSGADTDAGTGTYGPGAVNGLVQGTDTTNRFSFTVPVPGGVSPGTQITATATLGGETSEFSGVVQAANLPGITVTPTSGLITTEAGGTATFTIVLNTQPTANVVIGLSSNDLTEGTVSPASVTFTSGNWNVAQTVTVTGVDDALADGNIAYSIVTAPAVSTDPSYSGLDASDVSVTNTDNDVVGVTVNPTSGLTTTEAGGTATFTVVLTSQPTANVVIGLSSNDLTEGTVAPASVTFTSGNWNVAQTVTVTGVDDALVDGNIAYSIVTAAAVSADPGYSGFNPSDVSVTNTDNDVVGVTVSPTSGLTTTEAGGTATFTVVLTSQPTANVVIGLSSNDLTEGTVAPASVTFTPGNWNVAQTVTVTGVDDAVADGNIAYSIVTAAAVSADPGYSGFNPSDVSVTNTDNDVVGVTVNPTSGLTTTEAGGTATFTVVLTSQPTANVVIGVSSNDLTEGTVAPASVTFTPGNWNVAQTVTVTGVDDALADGNIAYSIVTAAAVSADPGYSGFNPSDVSVTNTDNDVVGVTVSPTSGLTTTEAGGTATFTVVLTSQPTANVTIGLSSNDLTEGTVAPASVTFTPGNWNVAQTVTVTGVDDAVVDGAIAYSIVTAAAVSADPGYSGFNPSDVSVTNTDNDVVGVTVNPTSGLTTTEAGGTATFTVVLTSQPTANVVIGLSSNDLTEGTVAPASVTFTPGNWNVAQTVTVTGVDDALADGNIAYSIVTAAAVSTDPGYSGFNPSDVSVTNTDDDVVGVTVNPTLGLTTTEAGGTATFTVVLTSQPTANVVIGLSSNDLSEGTVAPASVTFTPGNWNVAQTVTVTGVDDALADGNIAYSIVTAAAVSADPGYSGFNPSDVSVTNTDNDVVGVTVNPTSGLTTTEAGGTATFTVVLTSQPTANVTIGLSSSDLTEGTVAPASVTFTPGNWNVAQTVTVTGVDDAVVDGNIAYSIVTAVAVSADPGYGGFNPSDVSVTNTDDDVVGVTVNPTSGLTTTEAGGTATFTLILTSQPTANVTIGLSSNDLTEGTVAPASVTFAPGNWNVAQTVTVTGVDDAVVDGNIGYTVVTAAAVSADPGYNGFNPSDVSVTNADDDVAGIAVNPTAGLTTTEASGTATFTVVLNTQPIANVTIGLSSNDLTEGTVAPASITFTPGNWNVAQTVTVTGVDDAVVDGNIAYSIVTAAAVSTDPTYSGFNASDVSVTNNDDDVAGVTVNPTSGLTTTEAGGTATFTVVLTSQPTANVTIGLSSNDLTEGTVAPAGVTFTPGNWNVAQTVTVTGVDDAVVDGNIGYTVVTAAAVSTDPTYSGFNPSDVSMTNNDDDVAGVTVSPTSGLTTTEAGGTATFTVVLTSQPTANVVIGLSSNDLTEGTVAPASVTFTPGNWNVAQTVTVAGVDDAVVDGNVAFNIITAAAVSTDPGYSGFNPSDVAVTNTDDDVAGVTVNPTSGLTTTEAGGTATFTMVLTSQPTANVSVGLSSSDLTEGTVAPAGVTFTPGNWNVAQTVTVTGVDDAVVDGNVAYTIVTAAAVSTDAVYNGFNPSDVSLTNTDNDIAGVRVTPTVGLTTTEAGGTATFTVTLNSQPTANVTIGLSTSDLSEGTVAPAGVTFTPGNWNVAQTVTVTGVDDAIVDGNIGYTIITAAAVSTDGTYSGFNPSDVFLTNNDNDVAGVTVNPTSGLTTTEAGGTATFTVVLNSQPTANVTVGLSSSDLTEGAVAPASVTFTPGNWNVAQTVTVTGVDDAVVDGNIGYTIITAAAGSTDPVYSGINPSDVSVTNNDDDVAGVTVNPTAGLTTTEAGGTATFTVVLNSQPIANVTIGLSSSDLTEGTVAPASVTFTPGNWNVAQTVTVTGVDDAVVDGNVAYSVVTAAAVSTDPAYSGFDPSDVAVTNNDDDIAGVTVNPTSGLTTTEAGGTATFTIALNSQPTANVTIGLSSSNLAEGTVAPASVTFTPGNWNVAQTVTVTGVDDAVVDGNVAYSIVTAAAVSADPGYSGFDPADVAVTNTDNDLVGVVVNPTSGLTTTEAGGTATFTIVLNSQPTADVTVALSSSDLTEGTVAPASVTFTPGNWNVAQTVTVTGVDDAVVDGNVGYTITTAAAVSTDPAYSGFDPSDVAATNTDNDLVGVVVNPTSGLTTTEAGGTATFTIVLNSQPTADVTIGLSSSNLAEGTVAPAGVTFTPGNWNVAQTVTVTGVDDAVVDGNVGYTIITAAAVSTDPVYSGFDPADVAVTNTDNDTAAPVQMVHLDLTPDPNKVEVGEATTFTLRVSSLTASPIAALDIVRELPPGFAIVPSTATRDANPIADSGASQIAIGALPGLVDSNGNGHADPGEPGYTVIRWRAVVGAGVSPGDKTAAATAVSGCATCVVSNRAEATLSIEENALLARGTILGRVFEDRNRDGFQDGGEPGIFGATVALDNGTSVTTDADGLFHVPDVDSGQRLLKLDIGRFPYPATPTTDVATVARVSGGLITSVRFGVAFDRDTLKVGAPPIRGLALVADDLEMGVDVAGNAVRSAVVVNGAKLPVRTADVRAEAAESGEILRLSGDRFDPPAVFRLQPGDRSGIRRWSFEIRSSADSLVRAFEGTGAPPARVEWNGELQNGGVLHGGEVYAHQLKLVYEDGSIVEGPRRTFGIDRQSAFGLTMTGDAFATGSAKLTGRAMDALSNVARDIRRSAGDTVFVEGYTDSVGSAASNLKLSKARAEAAAEYLVDHERIPRERLAVRGYGESRPIASNGTPEGRELNRRVEIFGNRTETQKSPLRDVYRGRAVARVNGLDVPVDSVGRFAVRVPAQGDSLEVVLTDRSEQTTRAIVRLPKLQVLEPSGEVVLPFGGETPTAKVDPLNPSPLAETEVASLRPMDGTRRAATIHFKAKTDPGVRASVDGRALPVASDGTFEADLPLHVGRNAFGVVLQDSTGVMTVGNVVVSALDRTHEGGEVIAIDKIPDMTVYLPPSGAVLSSPILGISGETGVGNRIFANGDSIPVASNGTFAGTITLPEGRSKVSIDVVDPSGRQGHLERYMEVKSKRMFLVAIADGVVGGGAGPRGETGTWTDGRLAYQLRGWIAGRVLVTSAFDSERRTWGNLFRGLGTAETERLITNLDPDRLYPVFGDASAASYATSPNGGRFYVALESDAVRASVGDFPIALDEVELAAFHRTLYGAQVQVQPSFLAKPGDPTSHGTGTALKVFGAGAGHVHVRDVLEATGGTLYYLSRRDIIEGSVQATLCVRDRNTGLPLARIPQMRGVDYIVKEIEGRIIFNRPIASTSEDGSLLNGGQLGGNPVSIEVDYEANASPTESAAVGGRLSQALGPVQIGGTLIQDETGASPYTLRGTDARLRLGAHSWLGTEYAQSEGRAARAFGSADGGFSFAAFDTGSAAQGNAWKVASEVDAGDWLGVPGRVTVGGFVKRVDDGFVSDSENNPLGSRQIGAHAQVNSGKWGIWSTRYDQDIRFASTALPGQGQSDLFGAQWRRDARRMGVAAEYQNRSADSTQAQQLAGVRVWYQLAESLRTTVEHQQSLSGTDIGQTALGLTWGLPMGLSLEGRASDGTEGRAFRGGASFAVGGRRVYLRQELLDSDAGPRAMTVVGAQSPLGPRSRVFSEYQWLNQGGSYSATSVVGAEQGWQWASGVRGSLYGERGGRAGASASLPHTTVALELGYGGKLPIGFTTRGEYRRMDAGSLDHQYAIATHIDLRLIGGFSLLADHRLSEAFPNGPGATTRYEERGVGMAYRQPRSDRVEALARFTDLQDRRPQSPVDSLRATNGLSVAAVEVRMRLWPDLEWGLKGAARVMRAGDGLIAPTDAHSALFVSRMDYAFAGPFRFGVQYQQLAQREVGDRRGGLLQELTWDPQQHLRFGVGYNFSKISGDEFDRSMRDANGWFVRAQTRY